MKIVDEMGDELPQDGEAFGELLIRGPWVAAEYLHDPRSAQTFADGWMRTGDVCKITPDGYIKITDRAKDLIKSGGEWISSVELENTLMGHPAVAEAAVVGLKHPRWQERPVALAVLRPGAEAEEDELIEFLAERVAKWWLPDKVLLVEQIPKTGDRQVRQEGGARPVLRSAGGSVRLTPAPAMDQARAGIHSPREPDV